MKKFLVLLVVVAMTGISAMAFAASEIAVSGSIDVRSRNFDNTGDLNKNANDKTIDTQERVRLAIDAKVGDVKGRIQIENDEDTWGRLEQYQANNAGGTGPFLRLREAWINFNVPGVPVGVKAGHQFLQLGQGWFFRAMKYGSDAWVLYNDTGANHLGFVNVKASEGAASTNDDVDAYVLVDVFKLDDNNKIGIDLTSVQDRRAALSSGATGPYAGLPGGANPFKKIELFNLGLNYTGKLGPLDLKAEADLQTGKASASDAMTSAGGDDAKFKGYQVVIEGKIPMDPLTVNFTVARGSGNKSGSSDVDQIVTALDADPHSSFLFEYKIGNRGANDYISGTTGGAHTGFANVTALNVGAMFAALPSLSVGADIWLLQSTESVADQTGGTGTTHDLGNEIDVKVNWTLAENLTWNWTLGYFDPGKGMGRDAATGAQGVLMLKF